MAASDPIVAARRRLASNLRRLRRERGWTQEVAAERIGCSVQGYQRAERAVARVTLDAIAQIANAFAVDLRDLLAPTAAWRPSRAGRPPRERATTPSRPPVRGSRRAGS